MPPIVVQSDWDVTDHSTTNYDHMHAKITGGGPIPGLLAHSAGFADDGTWRVLDIWESKADCDRFMEERLMPLMKDLPAEGGPPDRVVMWELYSWMAPG